MNSGNHTNGNYKYVILLLCIGYFIDFYDLSIFGSGYVELFKQQFAIFEPKQVQQLYLHMSNWHTAGIFTGSVLFGILGDKFGRTNVIKYSILLYSVAILACLFVHSIPLFCALRFATGAGLACEFATSSVLIAELLSSSKQTSKIAHRSSLLLYASGILGGLATLLLSTFSWQIMFLFGGLGGVLLYFARKKLYESQLFVLLKQENKVQRGNILQLFTNITSFNKTAKLFFLIAPFNLIISIMFVFPNFMRLHQSLGSAIKIILLGFFLGGLLSVLINTTIFKNLKNYKVYLGINFIVALSILLIPLHYITDGTLFVYALGLGLICGAYPPNWIQLVHKSYGTNIRNTAANSLFAMGRASCIFFNTIISYCLLNMQFAQKNFVYLIAITLILAIISLLFTKDTYNTRLDYVE